MAWSVMISDRCVEEASELVSMLLQGTLKEVIDKQLLGSDILRYLTRAGLLQILISSYEAASHVDGNLDIQANRILNVLASYSTSKAVSPDVQTVYRAARTQLHITLAACLNPLQAVNVAGEPDLDQPLIMALAGCLVKNQLHVRRVAQKTPHAI